MGNVLRFPVERRFAQMQSDAAEKPDVTPPEAVLLVGDGCGEVSATFMGAEIPVIRAEGNGLAMRLRPPSA